MKKIMWVVSLLTLVVILNLGGVASQGQAQDRGKHKGWLMDPLLIGDGYISGTVFGDPDYPIHIYRGIPYAAPPVGDLRWQPPQPSAAWSGIRECVNFSINPVQFTPGRYFPIGDPESEDSLYLNVLTPATHTKEKLPVMVWFHGGGLAGASGNQIDWNRHWLPQHGVVLVTVNTRLGAFGLLAHPDLTAEGDGVSGNYMFLDMIMALEWVQRNIDVFGGNPEKVTIFGESGGGAKVAHLLASPLTKGLFHRAIVQSGGYIYPAPLADIEAWGLEFFTALGVTTLADARAMPWEDIVDAYVAVPPPRPSFGAAVDGWFLEDTPPNTFSAGKQNAVPIMVQATLGELSTPGFMPTMIDYYTKMLQGNYDLGIKSYAAIFDQVPTNWRNNGVISFHAMDLAYTFGIYDEPFANIWTQMAARTGLFDGDGNPLAPDLGIGDEMVSEDMMTRFASFAKTGNPNLGYKRAKFAKTGNLNPRYKRKWQRPVYWPAWTPYKDRYIYWNNGSIIKSGFNVLQ